MPRARGIVQQRQRQKHLGRPPACPPRCPLRLARPPLPCHPARPRACLPAATTAAGALTVIPQYLSGEKLEQSTTVSLVLRGRENRSRLLQRKSLTGGGVRWTRGTRICGQRQHGRKEGRRRSRPFALCTRGGKAGAGGWRAASHERAGCCALPCAAAPPRRRRRPRLPGALLAHAAQALRCPSHLPGQAAHHYGLTPPPHLLEDPAAASRGSGGRGRRRGCVGGAALAPGCGWWALAPDPDPGPAPLYPGAPS